MTTTINKQTVYVTTDCQCGEYYDEELEKDVPIEYCLGDCYEWQKDEVFALLGEWYAINDITEDDHILINGNGMTWQRLEGHKWTNTLELDGALSINGDFKIEWYLEDGTLTAKRWSHDEPTGTGLFTFEVFKGCDKCGEPVVKDIHAEELGMCVECSNDYFDHKED